MTHQERIGVSVQIEELEASCAAYREALEKTYGPLPSYLGGSETPENPCIRRIVDQALQSTAGADLLAELLALREVEGAAKRFKSAFDRGFPNSLNAIDSRDEIFEALAKLDELRSGE